MQFGSKAILGPNETGFDVVDVLDESSPSEDVGMAMVRVRGELSYTRIHTRFRKSHSYPSGIKN